MTAAAVGRQRRRKRTSAAAIVSRAPRREIPLAQPLDAVVLSIDAARTSGWSIFVGGKLRAYGECHDDRPTERAAVVDLAVGMGYRAQKPVGLVIESPHAGGRRWVAMSLAASVSLWRDTWIVKGQPPERVLTRTASLWRLAAFGRSNLPREQARKYEAALARQVVTRDLALPVVGIGGVVRGHTRPIIGPDAAAAISLGTVSIRYRELGRRLGLAVAGEGAS